MNSDLSLNVLTNVLFLVNHIYQLDNVTKCPVAEFNSTWQHLQTLMSQYTDNSLVSSSAVLTSAIVIHHATQSAISQSVQNILFSLMFVISYNIKTS